MSLFLLTLVVAWLAYSNGANDNFKGVATLYGSGAAGYKQALAWSTLTTLAGSITSVFLAERLLKVFSGAGLLPSELEGSAPMLLSVGFSAAATIYLATWIGMPTSTTHALIGALIGVAWTASSLDHFGASFLKLFVIPLLVSPIIAIACTGLFYPLFRWLRVSAGITNETCVCLTESQPLPAVTGAATVTIEMPKVRLDQTEVCRQTYSGTLFGLQAKAGVDALHFASAGAVCFSRAVNDTPKIAAILLALPAAGFPFDKSMALILVAVVMALGGIIQSRRVAETMSKKITDLNPGQGLIANLVTAALVLFASRLGVPVSTTHVSCGSIFGIALVQRNADWKTIIAIFTAWLTTLPFAALLSIAIYSWMK